MRASDLFDFIAYGKTPETVTGSNHNYNANVDENLENISVQNLNSELSKTPTASFQARIKSPGSLHFRFMNSSETQTLQRNTNDNHDYAIPRRENAFFFYSDQKSRQTSLSLNEGALADQTSVITSISAKDQYDQDESQFQYIDKPGEKPLTPVESESESISEVKSSDSSSARSNHDSVARLNARIEAIRENNKRLLQETNRLNADGSIPHRPKRSRSLTETPCLVERCERFTQGRARILHEQDPIERRGAMTSSGKKYHNYLQRNSPLKTASFELPGGNPKHERNFRNFNESDLHEFKPRSKSPCGYLTSPGDRFDENSMSMRENVNDRDVNSYDDTGIGPGHSSPLHSRSPQQRSQQPRSPSPHTVRPPSPNLNQMETAVPLKLTQASPRSSPITKSPFKGNFSLQLQAPRQVGQFKTSASSPFKSTGTRSSSSNLGFSNNLLSSSSLAFQKLPNLTAGSNFPSFNLRASTMTNHLQNQRVVTAANLVVETLTSSEIHIVESDNNYDNMEYQKENHYHNGIKVQGEKDSVIVEPTNTVSTCTGTSSTGTSSNNPEPSQMNGVNGPSPDSISARAGVPLNLTSNFDSSSNCTQTATKSFTSSSSINDVQKPSNLISPSTNTSTMMTVADIPQGNSSNLKNTVTNPGYFSGYHAGAGTEADSTILDGSAMSAGSAIVQFHIDAHVRAGTTTSTSHTSTSRTGTSDGASRLRHRLSPSNLQLLNSNKESMDNSTSLTGNIAKNKDASPSQCLEEPLPNSPEPIMEQTSGAVMSPIQIPSPGIPGAREEDIKSFNNLRHPSSPTSNAGSKQEDPGPNGNCSPGGVQTQVTQGSSPSVSRNHSIPAPINTSFSITNADVVSNVDTCSLYTVEGAGQSYNPGYLSSITGIGPSYRLKMSGQNLDIKRNSSNGLSAAGELPNCNGSPSPVSPLSQGTGGGVSKTTKNGVPVVVIKTRINKLSGKSEIIQDEPHEVSENEEITHNEETLGQETIISEQENQKVGGESNLNDKPPFVNQEFVDTTGQCPYNSSPESQSNFANVHNSKIDNETSETIQKDNLNDDDIDQPRLSLNARKQEIFEARIRAKVMKKHPEIGFKKTDGTFDKVEIDMDSNEKFALVYRVTTSGNSNMENSENDPENQTREMIYAVPKKRR